MPISTGPRPQVEEAQTKALKFNRKPLGFSQTSVARPAAPLFWASLLRPTIVAAAPRGGVLPAAAYEIIYAFVQLSPMSLARLFFSSLPFTCSVQEKVPSLPQL